MSDSHYPGPWLDTDPPKDGTPIIAVYRTYWKRSSGNTYCREYTGKIRWALGPSREEWLSGNIPILLDERDKMIIDWWLPAPPQKFDRRSGARSASGEEHGPAPARGGQPI